MADPMDTPQPETASALDDDWAAAMAEQATADAAAQPAQIFPSFSGG